MTNDPGAPRSSPPPVVVLRPAAANWLLRRVSSKEWREAIVNARLNRRDVLAQELEEAHAYLLHADGWLRGRVTSGIGNAETEIAEIDAESSCSPPPLGTAEVAEMLGLSDRRVRQLIGTGELKATRQGQRGWGFDRDSVDDYRMTRSTT